MRVPPVESSSDCAKKHGCPEARHINVYGPRAPSPQPVRGPYGLDNPGLDRQTGVAIRVGGWQERCLSVNPTKIKFINFLQQTFTGFRPFESESFCKKFRPTGSNHCVNYSGFWIGIIMLIIQANLIVIILQTTQAYRIRRYSANSRRSDRSLLLLEFPVLPHLVHFNEAGVWGGDHFLKRKVADVSVAATYGQLGIWVKSRGRYKGSGPCCLYPPTPYC